MNSSNLSKISVEYDPRISQNSSASFYTVLSVQEISDEFTSLNWLVHSISIVFSCSFPRIMGSKHRDSENENVWWTSVCVSWARHVCVYLAGFPISNRVQLCDFRLNYQVLTNDIVPIKRRFNQTSRERMVTRPHNEIHDETFETIEFEKVPFAFWAGDWGRGSVVRWSGRQQSHRIIRWLCWGGLEMPVQGVLCEVVNIQWFCWWFSMIAPCLFRILAFCPREIHSVVCSWLSFVRWGINGFSTRTTDLLIRFKPSLVFSPEFSPSQPSASTLFISILCEGFHLIAIAGDETGIWKAGHTGTVHSVFDSFYQFQSHSRAVARGTNEWTRNLIPASRIN